MIGENIKMVARRFFRPTPTSTRSPRASERRVREGNSWVDSQGRNIPDPWGRREYSKTRDIGTLPSVVGNILVSGPSKTQFGQRLIKAAGGDVKRFIQFNPDAFKKPRPFRSQSEIASQRTLHESEVVALDSVSRGFVSGDPNIKIGKSRPERLAQGGGGDDTHLGTLDSTRKHPGRGTDVLSENPFDIPVNEIIKYGEVLSGVQFVRRLADRRKDRFIEHVTIVEKGGGPVRSKVRAILGGR